MRCLAKRIAAFSVLFLLLVAAEGRAQVMSVKSGSISHGGNPLLSVFTYHSFALEGDGIIARGAYEKGANVGLNCNPCAPGQTLKLNVTINRFPFTAHGSATVNGLGYNPVMFSDSELKLSTTPVTILDTDMSKGLTARFTLSGHLVGYPFPFVFPLFNRAVEGEGVVRIYFVKSTAPNNPGYMFHRATYKFEARPVRGRKEFSSSSRHATVEQQ